MSALRVVQVGAGGMGRAWLATVAASADVELVGVVDLDLDAARAGAAVANAPDLPVGTDLTALAAETGAEAVLDITVPVAHHPVTLEALRAGLPVLGEKPAAQTVAEALALAAAAEATGKLFMVSQSRRYNDHLVAFRQHVRALGAIGSLGTRFARAPHFGGFREEMDDVLLLDMAIHAFDSARYVLECDPVSVYCESWNPSWSWYRGDANATAIFTFEDDARYVYDGSWCAPGAETSWNGEWRATGAAGSAAWDGDHGPSSIIDDAPGNPAAAPGVGTDIAGALASFAGAVQTGGVPDGEVHRNVMSLVMVDAAIASARSGQRVVLDDVLDQAHATAVEHEQDPTIRERLTSWKSVREHLAAAPAVLH